MAKRPDVNFEGERALQQVENEINEFSSSVSTLSLEKMNEAPKLEVEPQTKISKKEIEEKSRTYLKPKTTISRGPGSKFNEKFRQDFEFAKEYVCFIAENAEIIGESIDIWTAPFAGYPAEEWIVPVNTPVWGPRYLAEQIKNCKYHKLIMQENKVYGGDHMGQYYGAMAAEKTVQRLDAHPVDTNRKSVFMGERKVYA